MADQWGWPAGGEKTEKKEKRGIDKGGRKGYTEQAVRKGMAVLEGGGPGKRRKSFLKKDEKKPLTNGKKPDRIIKLHRAADRAARKTAGSRKNS